MKKLFFLAAALTVMASCADEKFFGEDPGTLSENATKAITIGSGLKAVTRANHEGSEAATLLNNKFVFAGTKGTSPLSYVFDQYNMKYIENTTYTTESNSSN